MGYREAISLKLLDLDTPDAVFDMLFHLLDHFWPEKSYP